MKILFAGPFLGELGWEIATWQPFLRAVAKNYDHVVVCAPSGHRALYADFVNAYLPYDVPTEKANMWMNEEYKEKAQADFHKSFITEKSNENVWLSPEEAWATLKDLSKWEQLIALQPQKFVRFGRPETKDVYDIVYHARKRDDWDSGFRNWLPEHCSRLLEKFKGLRIACIGRMGRSYCCGGDDLRDIPLSRLADLLSASKVLIGPISGPVHFGSLCGIEQVTWATKEEHKDRVKYKWNPFNIKTEVICADDKVWKERIPWTPEIDEIVSLTEKVLNEQTHLSVLSS